MRKSKTSKKSLDSGSKSAILRMPPPVIGSSCRPPNQQDHGPDQLGGGHLLSVIGIDPANGSMGVAVFQGGCYKWSDTLHVREKPGDVVTLLRGAPRMASAHVFIEQNDFGHRSSIRPMYFAAGTAYGIFLHFGVSMMIHKITPSQWRKVLGFPQAKKEAKKAAINHAAGLGAIVASEDEAEAICIADAGHRILSGRAAL